MLVPPKRALGWFTRPGRCRELAEWLLAKAGEVEAMVVSADMLCYGGLIASRLPGLDRESARARLKTLEALKRRRQAAPLYVFSTIMRLAPTLARERDRQRHQDLLTFARLCGEEGRPRDRKAALAARNRLGENAIAEYLAARARNLSINEELIDLAGRGLIDYLVIGQDDAASTGLHLAERKALEQAARARGLLPSGRAGAGADRIAFLAGADEMGLTLVCRAVCQRQGRRPRGSVSYSSPAGRRRVPSYEDRTLEQSAREHLLCAGARPFEATEASRRARRPDFLLFVHNSRAPGAGPRLARRVVGALEAGETVGVADVAAPNGADPDLAEALLASGLAGRLASYAAWNTAGNTLGTAIAQACLRLVAPPPAGEQAHLEFLLSRFLDDYLYQAVLRARLDRKLAALGRPSLRLGAGWREAEELARRLLAPEVPGAAQAILQGLGRGPRGLAGRGARLARWRVRLPWRRTFEIALQLNISASSFTRTRGPTGRSRRRRRIAHRP